jgi:hypothetical protein
MESAQPYPFLWAPGDGGRGTVLETLSGYERMKKQDDKVPPQGIIQLAEAVERLVHPDERTGKKDETAKWRKELDAKSAAQKKIKKNP